MKNSKLLTVILFFIASSLSAQEVILEPDSLLKKRVIKTEFFAPLTGNFTLGYEQYLKDFTSIEGKIGFIGLGKQENFDASGIFLKVGPKFKLKPSYATRGTFGTHLLRGKYIRPELAVSFFNYRDTDHRGIPEGEEINASSVALIINYGHQYVLGRAMTLDWHVGMGYGFSNDDSQSYHFGYTVGDSDTPLAFSAGFTIGFLLNK